MTVGFLVGPGVLGHVDGLHAAAERVGVAVINTWGAKGVFRFDSPFHGGTAGLQARDFELAGLGEVDVLLTSGLDPDEVTSAPWDGRAEVRDVEPASLAELARSWPHPTARPERPRLYTELAAVVGPMYDDPATPPARVRAMSEQLPDGGVVVAPPGLVGFWVARTWPTTVPGSVVVPARDEPGLVERLAAGAAASGRPTTLLTDRPTAVEGVDVLVWDDDLTIPQALLDVAGSVVAWA
jgi:thiamine pyrophosphate-dependent acetolactate synthase large subunit-like protein